MKKAFLFSVIFVLIFTTLIFLSIFYLRMMQMNELDIAQMKNIRRVLYVRDDIASDVLDYLQLSTNIYTSTYGSSNYRVINISDTLPSPYPSPSASLATYKTFISGVYSNETNLLDQTNISVISLNTTAFESAPSLQFIGSNSSLSFNYSYTNLSKNELIINGSSFIARYYITLTLNDTCLNNNCTNATWAGGPPNVDNSTAGLWHFDEGTGDATADSSGNGNTGRLHATTWNLSGKFGSALSFDGVSSSVQSTNNISITGTSARTTCAWVKPNEVTHFGTIAGYSDFYLEQLGGTWGVVIADIASFPFGTANTNWNHVCATYNGTHITGYQNGVYVTSGALSLSSTDAKLDIGYNSTGARYFNGTIDEVAIYSRAKSAAEIAADANLFHWDWSPIAMNSNLSAVWHFDEGNGTNFSDSSGNGNTGNDSNANWNSSGLFDSALNFGADYNYVEVPHSSSISPTDAITVEAWVNPTNFSYWSTVLMKSNSSWNEGYGLAHYLGTNDINFFVNSYTENYVSGTLEMNTWSHIAGTYNGTTINLYINGVLVSSKNYSTPISYTSDYPLLIGMGTGGSGTQLLWNGTIDEVAIYSRAKSAAEIAADANPIYVYTNLKDSLNNSILLRGSATGYVNGGANNTFYVKTSGGNLNMTVGAYSGLCSLRAYVNNTQVDIITTILENGFSGMQAVLPIQLRVYQQNFSNLVIAEN
ncbi:MAG: LamG domain-containing protein [Candidatus Micrarchaeota archaeon]|nr:LamG domain-containing protein [Candidatus Micrarchaeota archaeon]